MCALIHSYSLGLCVVGYICSSKLVPLSQYVGTALVCLLGVACLRGNAIFTFFYYRCLSVSSLPPSEIRTTITCCILNKWQKEWDTRTNNKSHEIHEISNRFVIPLKTRFDQVAFKTDTCIKSKDS